MGAFHAYDIRGIWNKDFNTEDVYKIGFFLPTLLKTNSILVGRDVRASSPEIYQYLVAGITDAGADVYNLGLTTTPMVYYATAHDGFDASVQITASHNPKEYNGMKISGANALPIGYDNGLAELERMVKSNPVQLVAPKGKIIERDIRAAYTGFLKAYKKSYANLKIGMDLSNGMAALLIKDVLPDEPILYLYDELDGTFPNHEPNPLVQENVADLKRLVREKQCDVGVIFDGDADRVMFVDEQGRFISPDLMIAVLGHYFFHTKGERGAVLQDIRSSKAVGEYLTPMGATMHTWRVGRAFAARKLREIDGIFGGELAGHYYFRDFFYSDSGILACLLILNVVAEMKSKNISVSQLIAGIERYENSGEINFRVERKQEAMEAVCKHFSEQEQPLASFDFDGYRLEFADWWFNIRPSNTEPYLRFIAEATSKPMLDDKVAQARAVITKFMNE